MDDAKKKGQSGDSTGEVSMSIEETNKMRISLGLKPLKVDDPKEKEKEKAAKEQQKQEAEKQRRILEIGGNIERLKKKRQLHEKLAGESLGQSLAKEGDSVAAWIQKSRTIQQEKELALKRAAELDQQDQQIESYSSKELKGLKVAHKLDQFQDTEGEIILTLKDTSVLKGSELNEDDVELESLKFKEIEKAKKNEQLRKKKPIYDKYDDTKKDILPQYNDDPTESEGFVLSDNGAVKEDPDKQLEEIRKKLQSEGKTLYSLDITKTVVNEYLPQQEVKFKKVATKKKKLRKKDTLELAPLDDESSNAKDHGSRKQSSAKMKVEAQNQQDKERREKSYARALEKAAEDTKALFHEEEEDDLYKSVTRAREATSKKKHDIEEIAQRVQQTKNKERNNDLIDASSVTFTATTEFIRAVQPEEPTVRRKVIEEAPEDKMSIEETISNEVAEHENMLREQSEKAKAKRKTTNDDYKEEGSDDEDVSISTTSIINFIKVDEPVASTLASTLKLLQSKGMHYY
jgi:U4/U6.U5 tri-snRNP-associated protein 1